MVASLKARGPDDAGFLQREWFALGFRRLAIFATTFGKQPVSSVSGDVHLAFNGELYNYEDLARDLARDRNVRVRSEVEALLALSLAYGADFTDWIDGDYAFVVGDERTRSCQLFRDPFGVKPLYYPRLTSRGGWAVASEVQAFFHHSDFST